MELVLAVVDDAQGVLARRHVLGRRLTEQIRGLRHDLSATLAPRWKRKPFYTVRELAQQVGRSPYTVRRWIREGKLNAVKLNDGRPKDQYLIEAQDIQELILSAGTGERTLVNTGASESPRSSSRGRGADSGSASPRSDGPCSDR
ncbi:MAG: helix-turn-helix domain-containing protein [Planctomycetes bacterium]|nr:helix-turn-helix domain-containing protein [Planctomycetota bacterium]